jgi:hypothetical protein
MEVGSSFSRAAIFTAFIPSHPKAFLFLLGSIPAGAKMHRSKVEM